MIRWLAIVWRVIWSLVSQVIWSLVSRPAGEALQGSETEQGPLPSPITRHKDGKGYEQKPLFWTSSPIQKLNDNIYELYHPNGEPTMEILFFHGLKFGDSGDAYLSTWTTGDGSHEVWPGTWLAKQYPNAHILSVSYDSSMRRTPEQGRSDLFTVAENLMQAIGWANIGQGFHRPVVLVGHSFGGLVMKQLCVKADQQYNLDPNSEGNQKIGKFLRNMGGLFFYGTPHRGINLPPLAAHFLDSPLLDDVKVLSAEGARLETIFNDVCKKYKTWHIASVGESQETVKGPFHLLVVPEASARYNRDFCTVPANHISICKPTNQTSNSFQRLINFIPKVEGGARFGNHQLLPKVVVGLDVRVEVVCEKLQTKARVGIHGMGGVGKTTLAMAVFNKLGPMFEYSCFCADVKFMKGTTHDVKKQIWEHMYCDGKEVAQMEDGWSKLRGKRLLLVLDDVARDIDFQVFLQVASMVAAESRFILTSRDKKILKDLDDIKLYEILLLSEKDAKVLFLSYAFPNKAGPPLALENHVNVVVEKCEGLPLTLEVLGKYLKGQQDGKFWKQAFEVLHKADSVSNFDDKLWEKLRLSYSGLGEEEQQMFLDATTFFNGNGWTLREAKAAWSASYGGEFLRWRSLVDASLVNDIEDDKPIKVHEQLRSLGRKIASENANKHSRRVWNGLDGLNLLQLTDRSDVQEIHSLLLSRTKHDHMDPINIPRRSLLRFKKLQYLDVDDEVSKMVSIDGVEGDEIFYTDLVLLRSPSLQFAQVHFDLALLRRLAILVLTNYGRQPFPNCFSKLSNLKILKIKGASTLETIPNEIGYLRKLEHLEFLSCERLTTLPESFGSLSELNCLKFISCGNLHTLPQSFGTLSALNDLKFSSCGNLHTLPESFGTLSALNDLKFISCANLRTLPDSFGTLSALNHLRFSSCENLHTLPESFGSLPALNHLRFSSCENLHNLPESFGSLSALNDLKFISCGNLHTLPQSFGTLSALKYLQLISCGNLHTLPQSFGCLSSLSDLEFTFCGNLRTLPESFGSLCVLNHLRFISCENLHTLPKSFGSLSGLSDLDFISCENLHTLPESFGSLSVLNHLRFISCGNLHTLPESFGSLSTLNDLQFVSCAKLHTLPESFGSLCVLNRLRFISCGNLHTLPESFGSLSTLNDLQFISCGNLHILPESFGSLSALNSLKFSKCAIVTLPESLGGLYALNHFEIHNCQNFLALPESFGGLSALNHVVISECPELRTLPNSFGGLSAHLDYLELNRCRKLERLPDSFSDLKALRHLRINLIALTSIPDCIKSLQSLQILELGSLPYLKGRPLWLGATLLRSPISIFQKFFRAQDGHFSSEDLNQNSSGHFQSDWDVNTRRMKWHIREWLYTNALDKAKALDYAGALASLDAVNDHTLDITGQFGLRVMRVRGIVKRDMGDLQGALEDFNHGLEEERGLKWDKQEARRLYRYDFLKHRGFVRFLLGDEEGAQNDGEEALNWQPWRRSSSQLNPSLGDQSVTYLNFRLPGCKEMEDQEKLMNLKMRSAFEKLRASDFGGALEDLNAVDDGLLWPAERGFYLRERGLSKRLTGDLGGALEDLNAALESYSKFDKDDYQCWRHRGYVKCLLGDIDGARTDAQTARELEESDKTNDSEDECIYTEELEESNMNEYDGKYSVLEQAALEGRLLEIDPIDFSFPDPPVYRFGYEGEF